MEKIKRFVFQVDSSLVKQYYNESDNIKVIDDDKGDLNICVIYFSSNELYYPNTEASFQNAIVNKDKYEWQNNHFPGVKRHIFVRDIQKQWYIEGVNAKLSTPDLLQKKLNELSSGYMIYTIGSSAGGFAAMLFGSMLGAKKVYAFNAQMDLNVIIGESNPIIDPLLFRYVSDQCRSKFFTVSNFLNSETKYFYFQSARSIMDIAQFSSCSKKHLLTKLEFSTSNHGFPFLRHDLSYVLKLSDQHLTRLAEKRMHPLVFSIQIHGVFQAIFLTVNAVKKRIGKKMLEKMYA
jgi:hypothetical protein